MLKDSETSTIKTLEGYYENQENKKDTTPTNPSKSGVMCAEKNCEGEMMIQNPEVNHPQLTLKRAFCSICNWRGWV